MIHILREIKTLLSIMLGDNNKNEPILIYDKSILLFQESYFWRKL